MTLKSRDTCRNLKSLIMKQRACNIFPRAPLLNQTSDLQLQGDIKVTSDAARFCRATSLQRNSLCPQMYVELRAHFRPYIRLLPQVCNGIFIGEFDTDVSCRLCVVFMCGRYIVTANSFRVSFHNISEFLVIAVVFLRLWRPYLLTYLLWDKFRGVGTISIEIYTSLPPTQRIAWTIHRPTRISSRAARSVSM